VRPRVSTQAEARAKVAAAAAEYAGQQLEELRAASHRACAAAAAALLEQVSAPTRTTHSSAQIEVRVVALTVALLEQHVLAPLGRKQLPITEAGLDEGLLSLRRQHSRLYG
jgi:hypothetical protein